MKKRYILGAVGLVLLGLGTSACSSKADNSTDEQATSKKADKLEKKLDKADKDAKKQSEEQTNNRFVGNTFKTNKGTIKIEKLTKVTLKNATSDGDVHYVVVDASFTNKSKKGVTPEDFFMDNLKLEQKLAKSTHEVGGERSQFEEDLTPWKDKINAKLDKVDPGQTVHFAMSYQLDKDDGDKDVDTYLLQPWNSDTMDTYGKPLKLTASSTQTITKPNDDSDSDTDTDN